MSDSQRRRRRTWHLTLVMLLGGVLTLAVAALYPAGYFYQFNWFQERPDTTRAVSVSEGYFLLCSFQHVPIAGATGGIRTETVSRRDFPNAFRGFRWWYRRQNMPQGPAITIPLWFVGAPAAAATGLAWWRRSVVRRSA